MRGYFRFLLIGLLITGFFVGGAMGAPVITPDPVSDPSTLTGVEQSFTANVNETADITWFLDGSQVQAVTNQTSDTYSNSTAPAAVYNVTVVASNANGTDQYVWTWTVSNPTPTVTLSDPSDPSVSNDVGESRTFTADVDQVADVTWILNGNTIQINNSVQTASYFNSSAQLGTHNLTVFASNANGTDQKQWTWTVNVPPAPTVTLSDPSSSSVSDFTGDSRTFTATVDQPANVTWFLNGNSLYTNTSVQTASYFNSSAQPGVHNITVFASNANGNDSEQWTWTVTNVPLSITDFEPSDDPETTVGDTQEFNITTNQICDVQWQIDGSPVQTNSSVSFASYVNTDQPIGSYNVTAIASNPNGTLQQTWTWDVRSKTFFTGDRIWDALVNPSLKYTWDFNSFSGFYFDLDTGEGSEVLTIELGDYDDRSIADGDIEYSTVPIETEFEHDEWGSYQVVGFMAERFFAAYDEDLLDELDVEDVSLMSDGQLAKVLIDDDEKESVFSGSSLVLEEGYALNIIEVDLDGDTVFVSLTKDGEELDSGIVSSDDDYIYEVDLGDADDVAIIIVHFADIFRGTETNAVFVEGIFQISDEYIEVDTGDEFGKMEVKTVSASKITMDNEDDISLSKGKTIDLMGKLQLVVADADELRFAPVVDMSEPGTYELRGTVVEIAEDEITDFEWTPLNFEGFYYDIDEGIQTETLTIEDLDGRTIDDNKLIYKTVPAMVEFEHGDWGEFQVIGFLAEKYFAGYIEDDTTFADDTVSILSDEQLSKVLIDEDEKTSVFSGSSLILEEGYALNIVEVDLDGDAVFVSLKKDGDELDSGIVSSEDDYIYETDLGDADDVPLIIIHFADIFRGTETNAVFVEGIFQISDEYITVESGESFEEMEVTSVSASGITLKNDDDISLSKDKTIDVMENIQFKVADDDEVRFYPFVEVSTAPLESLDIDMPTTISQGDEVTIEVTSRGAAVSGATVEVDGVSIGSTNNEGRVEYEPEEAGKFTVTAEKENFVSASAEIEVISPFDETRKISIEVSPEEVFEGERITISTVKAVGGDPLEDVEVFFDGKKIGETSVEGTVQHTVTEPGVHKITTAAEGYLEAEFNLDVQELAANFEFSNLVISPLEVRAGKDVKITIDAMNTGTASGSYNVDLIINNNVTDSQQITLDIDESTTVEFTVSEDIPGTYLVKVGDQTSSFEVLEKRSAVIYVVGAIILAIAGGAIYMFTAGGWTLEMLSAKISEFIRSIR